VGHVICHPNSRGSQDSGGNLIQGIEGLPHRLEDERYLIADDVVDQLKQRGDPWDLSRELPPSLGKAHSTPPMDKR
jgi:hypothetical protein